MATFTLAGEPFELVKSSRWTYKEAREFEQATGSTFVDLRLNREVLKSAATEQAILWISMRRVKPETKFSDLDSLSPSDIEWVDDDKDEPDEEPDVPPVVAEDPTSGEDSEPSA
jgi:hypothetical protein